MSESLRQWFSQHFGINNEPNKDEIQTNCPYCGHHAFYFNLSKRVGFCHRASCGERPTLKALTRLIGEDLKYSIKYEEEKKEEKLPPLVLPGHPLLTKGSNIGEYFTCYPDAVAYVRRRNIPLTYMIDCNMHCDGYRVYVPVYYNGGLCNYVGRDITGNARLKYVYAKGRKTSNYLYNWDYYSIIPNLSQIVLVENTFVSISLSRYFSCTTNFGSNLSDAQIKLLINSPVKDVYILWDEGAEDKAAKAVEKLRDAHINAIYIEITKQPDDHDVDELLYRLEEAYDLLHKGYKRAAINQVKLI